VTCAPGHAVYKYDHTQAQHVETYDCNLIREFPEPKRDESNPVVKTTVRFFGKEPFRMMVQHTLENGTVKTRSEQYRQDYKQTSGIEDDGVLYQWTGKRHSSSMKGQFTAEAEGGTPLYYSEEQHEGGKLSWIGVWACPRGMPQE
jgi:hypothetical protein